MDIRPITSSIPAAPGPLETDLAQAATKAATAQQAAPAATQPAAPPTIEQIHEAVKNINKSVQMSNQGVEFTVDEESHRTVVKVVDLETKEVLRQMPTEEALEIAKALDRAQGLIISHQA